MTIDNRILSVLLHFKVSKPKGFNSLRVGLLNLDSLKFTISIENLDTSHKKLQIIMSESNKMNCRNQFTFYKSFDDVIEDLTEKQIAEYIKVMLDVQFLRVKIDDVVFSDKTLRIVWKSQKHSIEKSVKGYLDSQNSSKVKNPYLGVYSPFHIPSEGLPQQEQVQGEVKGQEQVKGQEKEKKKNPKKDNFPLLSKKTLYSSLDEEYKNNLRIYAFKKDGAYCLESLVDYCIAHKKGYADYTRAYNGFVKRDRESGKHKGEETRTMIDSNNQEFEYANGYGFYKNENIFVRVNLGEEK